VGVSIYIQDWYLQAQYLLKVSFLFSLLIKKPIHFGVIKKDQGGNLRETPSPGNTNLNHRNEK